MILCIHDNEVAHTTMKKVLDSAFLLYLMILDFVLFLFALELLELINGRAILGKKYLTKNTEQSHKSKTTP